MSGQELFRPRNEFGGEVAAACGCTPGTPENGWHETRSEACQEAERHEWAPMLAAVDSMINEIRNARGKA